MPSRPSHRRRLLNHSHNHSQPPFLKSLVISVAVVCSSLILLLLLLVWFVRSRKSRRNAHVQTYSAGSSHGCQRKLKKYKYKELKKATNRFDETQKLGKGGYGVVYRGLLKDGEEVAVKKLVLSSIQGEREFQNELAICRRLESRYVVKLLGFASHGEKVRLLVYECMQNRSLQETLLEKHTSLHLNWQRRFGIILDIARALAYLHLECRPPIIHGDVKPSNVLLDGNFRAYLADFGLARTKAEDQRPNEALDRSKLDMPESEIGTPESAETPKGKSFEILLEKERKHCKVFDTRAIASLGDQSQPSSYLDSPHSGVRYSSDLRLDAEVLGSTSASPAALQPDHVCSPKVLPVGGLNHVSKPNDDVCHNAAEGRASLDQTFDSNPACQAAHKPANKENWWWKQENSGELKVRDYVMEWMKSELSADQSQRRVAPAQQEDQQKATAAVKDRKDLAMKKRERQEQRKRKVKAMEEGRNEGGERTKARMMGKKGREWWKDEYFAELSKKGAQLNSSNITSNGRGNAVSMLAPVDRVRASHVTGLSSHRVRGDSIGETVLSDDLSSTTTSMRGTVCYVAPEFGGVGVVSEAIDIYSFGVLLLVIISGRRPLEVMASSNKTKGVVSSINSSPTIRRFERANLITWARNLAYSGNVFDLLDDRLHGAYPREQAQLCITLALLCIRKLPSARPTISSVVKILLGESTLPPLPIEFSPSPPSRLSIQQSPLVTLSCLSSSEDM